VFQYVLVAICITLAVPAGIFVPSFVLGACGGRILGEILVILFPEGIRGAGGPQIYPGLYAVVGEFGVKIWKNKIPKIYVQVFFLRFK
jgi:chloride channel 2